MKLRHYFLVMLSAVFFNVAHAAKPLYITSIKVQNQTVIASSLLDGIYISKDQGATWSQQFASQSVHSLTQTANNILYAPVYNLNTRTNTIYQSSDTGANWNAINWNFPEGINPNISITNINLQNAPTLYVGSTNGLYVSNDNGATSTLDKDIEGIVFSIPTSNNGVMYAGTSSGLYIKIGPTQAWVKQANVPATRSFVFINSRTILAGTNNGIYQTTDGGMTWNQQKSATSIPSTERVTSLIMKIHNILYAGTDAGAKPGIYRSVDDGKSWTLLTVDIGGVSALALDNTHLYAGGLGGISILPLS